MKKSKKEKTDRKSTTRDNLLEGIGIYKMHPFFSYMSIPYYVRDGREMGKETPYFVKRDEAIWLNQDYLLTPKQWAYVLAHGTLHFVFGHFDADKMPGYEIEGTDGKKEKVVVCDTRIWNLACDIYIMNFLKEMKFGQTIDCYNFPMDFKQGMDELKIYEYLMEHLQKETINFQMDMRGLENPNTYGEKRRANQYAINFSYALAMSVTETLENVEGAEKGRARHTFADKATQWFLNNYPLLGSLAASFQIIYDHKICQQNEIQIAAIDVEKREIYINPTIGLCTGELRFILAHEYLHAGLQHHERCQGRDPYLWNIACDYVINGWLNEMEIGSMPEQGVLYDESLSGMSAEEIYDKILAEIRYYSKQDTFRGYGKGDILKDNSKSAKDGIQGVSLDDFCRSALAQGLEYQKSTGRGYIPAGLIEEIRALAMPVIPWDVELARWFDLYIAPLQPKRTYARPSRRQGATPDIPRPRYTKTDISDNARTFGVVVDTSGSVSTTMLGKALGSIASYAAAKEVSYVRVIFCDASAYDAGFLAPEDIAGRVVVKGRGGTRLQPGVDLLENAKDFPSNGPILIITDGEIENWMHIQPEHAFLIPKGRRLPFKARGKVFYFD